MPMPSRIPEPELIIPTLELLDAAPNGEMQTANIIASLVHRFQPEGEDNAILENRADTKFTQKVRNLKSHKTLLNAGLATHIYHGFKITDVGRKLIASLRKR